MQLPATRQKSYGVKIQIRTGVPCLHVCSIVDVSEGMYDKDENDVMLCLALSH